MDNTNNTEVSNTDTSNNVVSNTDTSNNVVLPEESFIETEINSNIIEEIDIPFDSNNITYNSNFKCTYQIMDDLDDSNNLYRIQFLQAFNTYRWDSNIIDNTIQHIYSQLTNSIYGRNILKLVNLNVTITNFIHNSDIYILFSYDYFYIFHDCLCDLINNGKITDDNYNYLITQINNK
jgi:hypothetical protein